MFETKKHLIFAPVIQREGCSRLQKDIGVWCNGNTTDSGPVFPGSSPGTPTEAAFQGNLRRFLFSRCLSTKGSQRAKRDFKRTRIALIKRSIINRLNTIKQSARTFVPSEFFVFKSLIRTRISEYNEARFIPALCLHQNLFDKLVKFVFKNFIRKQISCLTYNHVDIKFVF